MDKLWITLFCFVFLVSSYLYHKPLSTCNSFLFSAVLCTYVIPTSLWESNFIPLKTTSSISGIFLVDFWQLKDKVPIGFGFKCVWHFNRCFADLCFQASPLHFMLFPHLHVLKLCYVPRSEVEDKKLSHLQYFIVIFFFHLFIHHSTITEHWQCAKHCCNGWEYNRWAKTHRCTLRGLSVRDGIGGRQTLSKKSHNRYIIAVKLRTRKRGNVRNFEHASQGDLI